MSGCIRKCFICQWADFNGYGFNLHAEKGKSGQYIGAVDDNSPAEAGGLKQGDRIVEVNGVNIGNENHQQVVARIKAGGKDTTLLVVDKEADDYYRTNKIVIHGDLADVKYIECPKDKNSDNGPVEGDVLENDNDNDYEVADTQPKPVSDTMPEHVASADQETVVSDGTGVADTARDITIAESVVFDEELPPPPPPLTDEEIHAVDLPAPAEGLSDSTAEPEVKPMPTSTVEEYSAEVDVAESAEPEECTPSESVVEPAEYNNEPEPLQEVDVAKDSSAETASPAEETSAVVDPTIVSEPEPTPKSADPATVEEIPKQNGSSTKDPLADTKKLSAAEMRELLKKKKKPDPRAEKLSASDKLKMFQRL